MKRINSVCTALTVVAGVVFVGSAHADFAVIDTFESYNVGLLDGQVGSGWYSPTSASFLNEVAVDPTDAGNQAMQVTEGSSTNQRIANTINNTDRIAVDNTGTLFFRVYLEGQIAGENREVRIGLSDQNPTTATGTGVHETYLQTDNGDTFQSFDGPTGENGNGTQTLGAAGAGAWYNVWMVADTAALTYDLFIEGPGFTGQQLVADDFGFRNANTVNDTPAELEGELGTIFLRPSGGNPTAESDPSRIWFDDFYIDNSGQNLTNPIPEPSSLALAGLGAGLLLGLRRRK